jgi:hypothetical protein
MKIFEMVSRRIVRIGGMCLGMNINVGRADGKHRFLSGLKSEAKPIEEAGLELKR